MNSIQTRYPCSCGNTNEPIFWNNGTKNGYEGFYFVIGQVFQGGSSASNVESPSGQRQQLGEINDNRVDAVENHPSQPPLAIDSSVVTSTSSNVCTPVTPPKQIGPAPPPPPPVAPNFPEFDTPSCLDIADAVKRFHISGKRLRPAKDRVLGPVIGRPLRRTMSSATSVGKTVENTANRVSSGSSDNADNMKNVSGSSDGDTRSIVVDAMKKRISLVRGDGNSTEEEAEHDWE